MTSTKRKAASENTVPRRTMVSSFHTHTAVTCTQTMPSSTMVITETRTPVVAPSRSAQNSGPITTCTNNEPASTRAITMRRARTVGFPMPFPLIEQRQESIDFR